VFAFSNFVMSALADLPNDKGMFAMQRINEDILNPIFFVFFVGTPVLCLLIIALAALEPAPGGRPLLLAGAIGYLAGPFGITVLFNVPLNNKLAQAEVDEANDAWPRYRQRWQRWNHIRTYIGILSIALLSFGLASP
jgi:uncharacterized membrane protein